MTSERNVDNASSDERSPLLGKTATPLPKLQVLILIITQLTEEMSATVIFPFIEQMITELGIAGDDPEKVGYYVGLMFSLFYATEALTIYHWSRLSDRIGRKPVLLFGLAGVALSLILIGFSRSYWWLLVARCLCGALNGNMGVAKSAVGELTDKTNIAQAFAMMPAIWSVGGTIAPVIGGILQHPAERWPRYFSHPFWQKYPYFLPCFATASAVMMIWLAVLFFLEETHPALRKQKRPSPVSAPSETVNLLAEAANTAQHAFGPSDGVSAVEAKPTPASLRTLLRSPQVRLAVSNYAVLAFLESAIFSIQPHFLAAPVPLGGLARPPRIIGYLTGAFGLICGGINAAAFAPAVRVLGPQRLFVTSLFSFALVWIAMGGANVLARLAHTDEERALSAGSVVLLTAQYAFWTVMELGFGTIMIFITSAAPDKYSLGATNGIAQQAGSIMRTIGPAIASSLFAFSFEHKFLNGYAAHLILFALTLGAAGLGIQLPLQPWERDVD